LLAPHEKLERMLADSGIVRGDKLIAYCRSGRRASLGYLALRELGYDVRLFDGSYAEWTRAGLPVEK
jgi:thiosulfate/3-mercaptopyruvate sulfurtransferase